ncbi:hypothetical protein ABBQ32_008553 [Trebouxia sp. C0010 RCD-2024]
MSVPCVIEVVERGLAAMKAMTGSRHALTLLSDGTALMDGAPHHLAVTRYLETVSMEDIISADFAAASAQHHSVYHPYGL